MRTNLLMGIVLTFIGFMGTASADESCTYQAKLASRVIMAFNMDDNEVLTKAEAIEAFQNYPTLTNQLSRVLKTQEKLNAGVFLYLLNYEQMPDMESASGISKLLWFITRSPMMKIEKTEDQIFRAMNALYHCN